MKRKRTLFQNYLPYDYNVQDEPLIISKTLMDIFLLQNNPSDCGFLYSFYYYTAKWQKTNQPKATTIYVAKGLKWGAAKVRKVKKQLISLGLVKDIISKDPINNKVIGHYIKINFIWRKSHPIAFPEGGFSHSMENEEGNALSSNNINTLKNNNINAVITTILFDSFWRIYPKKASKGSALNAWKKLCNKSKSIRPTWREIKTAIIAQKKTPQWSNKKYIANASTWLNQNRWMDDPSEMTYCGNKDKPERIMDNGEWYYLDEKGRYKNTKGQYYIDD